MNDIRFAIRTINDAQDKIVKDLRTQGFVFDIGWTEEQCRLIVTHLPDDIFNLVTQIINVRSEYTQAYVMAVTKEKENRAIERILGIRD